MMLLFCCGIAIQAASLVQSLAVCPCCMAVTSENPSRAVLVFVAHTSQANVTTACICPYHRATALRKSLAMLC
jgi:hypothetical protein